MKCVICDGEFKESSDSLVLCAHKGGQTHLGCCINRCSWDKKPCEHSHGVYDKLV